MIKYFSVGLMAASVGGCSASNIGPENLGAPNALAVNSQTSRIAGPLQCFVRDSQRVAVLPSFGAFSFVRDGKISASAFERPDLARSVMATNNNVLKKARYIEYVRAVTKNDQEAIELVRRVRSQVDSCFNSISQIGNDNHRRLKSLAPNQPVNTGSRVITARQAVAEFDAAYERSRRSQAISRQLYDNIIADLSGGRTTQSIRISALDASPTSTRSQRVQPKKTSPPVQEREARQANLPEPLANATSSTPEAPSVNKSDTEFDRLMKEAYERNLLGIT